MKIIIPMAGWGKRLRPHTLTVPKPMVTIAGKPIVEHLVGTLANAVQTPVTEIYFVIRKEFGEETESTLRDIASRFQATPHIVYQDSPEGTAHAVHCAKEALQGPVIIAFADTLFDADFQINEEYDGIIWTKQVEDPSAFGVVHVNDQNIITDFIEKPTTFVSDLAIIGIYYFKNGQALAEEIQYLIDNNLREKEEFQITNALERMKNKGSRFVPGVVKEWLDCGNKDACIHTNQRILELRKHPSPNKKTGSFKNTVVIEPCHISENVLIENSVIGPYVSIEKNSKITNAVIQNSVIQENTIIENKVFNNSMIGKNVRLIGTREERSIGDYSTEQQE